MAGRVQMFDVQGHVAEKVGASKERAENSHFILSNPQCSISTDLTVAAETIPWGPFSVISEHP